MGLDLHIPNPVLVGLLGFVVLTVLISRAGGKRFPALHSGAVLLTGTSSGIGRRAALFLASKGFVVLAGVRKPADGDALVADAPGSSGKNIRPVIIDVAKPESIEACLKAVTGLLSKEGLKLVAVINNAGLLQDSTVEFHALDEMKKMFDVNYYGLVAVTQRFLPLIRKSKGRVINIGSVAGGVTFPRFGAYSASKYAVEAITDALRVELEEYGVAVALVQPGFCRTELFAKGAASAKPAADRHAKSTPVGQDVLDVYGDLYTPAFEKKSRAPMEGGSDPGVVVEAVHHALTSPYPKARYPVAKINKAPVWLVFLIHSLMPDRVWDKVTRRPGRA